MEQTPMKSFNPHGAFFYNYKLFEGFKCISENSNPTFTDHWNLVELFKFIESNFVELHNKTNMLNIIAILHNTIRLELSQNCLSSDNVDISAFIFKLLKKYENSEDDQQIILQILYQILKSTTEEDNVFVISEEIFSTLHELLFFKSGKKLAANILSCIRLYINIYKKPNQIVKLWDKIQQFHCHSNMSQKISIILVYLIPEFLQHIKDFYRNEQFIEIVQVLLLSHEREKRKSAIYLLKKIIPAITNQAKSVSLWEIDQSTRLNISWNAYVAIFENLEEKQSHLILPTLENIKCIDLSPLWMQLLYHQLLQHNNNLVTRWTIDHMLETFKSIDLNQDLLKNFLNAANNTHLYNYDNYCISNKKITNFLNCDLSKFMGVVGDINWKAVPLHFWLSLLDKKFLETVSTESLMKISARVRALQNKFIRYKTIEIFENKFEDKIKSLKLVEYLRLIETLYNVMDDFKNYEMLLCIFKNNPFHKEEIILTQRMYEKLSVTIEGNIAVQIAMMQAFSKIPPSAHGCFCLLVIFDFDKTKEQIEFCRNMYKIDLSTTDIDSELNKVVNKPFGWHEKIVDYLTLRIECFEQLLTKKRYPEELLETGGWKTIKHLSEIVREYRDLISRNILNSFVKALVKYKRYTFNFYTVLLNLFVYCKRHLSLTETNTFVNELLNSDIDETKVLSAVFTSRLDYKNIEEIIKRLFLCEATNGDSRIEERYAYEHRIKVPSFRIRQDAIDFIKQFKDSDLNLSLFHYLFKLNKDISTKKPRYYENSYEHRIKLRIAIALMQIVREIKLSTTEVFDIIAQNNQLNVLYIYERIIASCSSLKNIFQYLSEAPKHSASQQVSIICICNAYCLINWPYMVETDKRKIVEMLLPLTMGANFQTRLYSQLVLYKLLERSDRLIINKEFIVLAIRNVIGDRLNDLLHDIRIDITIESILQYDIVLYVTNAPFDELTFDPNKKEEFKQKFSKNKKMFCKKTLTLLRTDTCKVDKDSIAINVQRKMNPDTGIIASEELISYPECQNKKDMEDNIIVVSSLIDKLPNLGGIARTCEVFGIKNLVMNSLKYVNHIEFKTLSMSAENGLNITEVKSTDLLEFLIQKQHEGFEIVGAEQTSNNKSFVDFKFPKKCILLLGHEKEGIPSDLITILDHTVEIPQFGLVRSLNVHVTGALFMWEYCKQHIANM